MLPLLAALLFVVALASCGASGGDDKADGVASLGTGDTAEDGKDKDAGTGKDATEEERQDAMVDFAKCMRKHGVDMPDPVSSGDGKVSIAVPASGPVRADGTGKPGGTGKEGEKFEKADKACGSILEDVMGEAPEMSPEEEAEMRDDALAFSKCMRKHGVDMPDPTFDSSGGGVTVEMGRPGESGPLPSDKTFQKAQKACSKVLGGKDGKGPSFQSGGTEGEGPSSEVGGS